MNRNRNSVISVGTVSIVLIFVLLCMLTFSVLSLVSAQADLRLSQKSADRTTAYYAAENAANDLRIQIEEAAAALQAREPSTGAALAQAIAGELGADSGVSAQGDTLSYQVPLEEEQLLLVTLTVAPGGWADGLYSRVDTWQVVSQHDWTQGSIGELFDPNDFPFQ